MTDDHIASSTEIPSDELIDKVLRIQHERIVGEMEDANLLLEFALASGESVPDSLIADLVVRSPDKDEKAEAKSQERFQRAYRDLVQCAWPRSPRRV